jgi:hypothetical protein
MTMAEQRMTPHLVHQVQLDEAATTVQRDLAADPGLSAGPAAHDDDHVVAVETLCVGEAR